MWPGATRQWRRRKRQAELEGSSLSRRWLTVVTVFGLLLIGTGGTARAGIITYPTQPPANVLDTKAHYLVLMVLDGARPDYLNITALPHLAALEKRGTVYQRAFAGVLESETPTGHATISTGSTPQRSGILGFSWAENDKNFSIFNPQVVRSGAMEQIMRNYHAPTIAGLYKARFPTAAVAAISGYKYYAVDPLGGPSADAIEYFRGTLQKTFAPTAIPGHVPPASVFADKRLTVPLNSLPLGQDDHLATLLALDTFAAMHQRITLINYPDFDWPLGHVDGGIIDRPGVTTVMKTFDADLAAIEDAYRQAGILKQTIFVVTADHGMSPIRRFIPGSIVDNAVKAAGTTAPSIARNTATYVWLANPKKDAAVAENIIQAHDPGIQSAYYLVTGARGNHYLPAPGSALSPGLDAANRYLLQSLLNAHEPQVVVFTRKGQTMSGSSTHWKADHGGASWGVQHLPLVIAGPGIKQGQIVSQPAQLEDIAPTVLTAMGVRPDGMQGHVLTEALTDPYAADVTQRANEVAMLTPIVNAMVADDRTQGKHK